MKPVRFCFSCLLCSLTLAMNSCTPQPKANEGIPVGFLPQDIKTVDSLVGAFMKKYHVPGLSFTIARFDSIKIERCYGYADKEKRQLMQPDNRFRIASISKSITATAIMKLVEQGRLSLQNKVFGKGAILGTTYGSYPYKKWVEDITVEHLLEHVAGGWSDHEYDLDHNQPRDPMFVHPEMNQPQIISWALDNQPLKYEPGTRFQYSSFGFCLLGRVIEKITGMKYEEYVRKNILQPCGITDMQIGGNTLAERLPGEVHYYEDQDDPYVDFDGHRGDSKGGWIATPTDLVKFIMRVDKFPQKTDILEPATLDTMFSPSPVNLAIESVQGWTFAKGWVVDHYDSYGHGGAFPGQQSIILRTHEGFCWAVIVNTWARKGDSFQSDMSQLMWHIRMAINNWPNGEL
jgi:CubicO group peptidase (beta-lactamase class C family)